VPGRRAGVVLRPTIHAQTGARPGAAGRTVGRMRTALVVTGCVIAGVVVFVAFAVFAVAFAAHL
jgi:hypothetical protein